MTKTPITDGSPCRIVILGSNDARSDGIRLPNALVGSSAIYKPVERPFRCRYDEDTRFACFDGEPEDGDAFRALMTRLGLPHDGEETYEALDAGYGFRFIIEHEINYCFIAEAVFTKLQPAMDELKSQIDEYVAPYWLSVRKELEVAPESDDLDGMMRKIKLADPQAFFRDHFHFNRKFLALGVPISLEKFLGWGVIHASSRHYIVPFAFANDPFPIQRIKDASELWVLSTYLDSIRSCWMQQGGQGSQEFNGDNQYELLIEMIRSSLIENSLI
ncbi:hypothetical protein RYA05_13800 [Pseudomonas syringae pv. actinidiae]|nr:hypothetical protein [Pseudomonas syringae pv. actinidiae]